MAKKRKTPADPEPTPRRASLAALKHRPSDPAQAAFAKRLGPERMADLAAALRELTLGRLDLMANRLARHEERRQMLATHERLRQKGVPGPASAAWVDEWAHERYAPEDAAAEQDLARLTVRIDRIPLEADAERGRPFRPQRHRGAVNALTAFLRPWWDARDRTPSRFDIAAYLDQFTPANLAKLKKPETAPHGFHILTVTSRQRVLRRGRAPVWDAEIDWQPARGKPRPVWAETLRRRLASPPRRHSSR